MDLRRLRTAVHHLDAQGRLMLLALGVGDPDLKKAVLVEDSRIEQLVLRIELGAEGVLLASGVTKASDVDAVLKDLIAYL